MKSGSGNVNSGNSILGNVKSAAMPEVNRVGTRVPPFWPEQSAVWFHQIAAQFALNGADTTKFYYVISQLELKYALKVEDIFASPPDSDTYKTLKREFVQRLSTSQGQRIRQLLEQEEMGDQKPSQFLCHMRNLAGKMVMDDFLRTLWSSRLPVMTRAIINAQADLPLTKLEETAYLPGHTDRKIVKMSRVFRNKNQ